MTGHPWSRDLRERPWCRVWFDFTAVFLQYILLLSLDFMVRYYPTRYVLIWHQILFHRESEQHLGQNTLIPGKTSKWLDLFFGETPYQSDGSWMNCSGLWDGDFNVRNINLLNFTWKFRFYRVDCKIVTVLDFLLVLVKKFS